MRDDFHEGLLVVPKVPDLQLAVVEDSGKPTGKGNTRPANKAGKQTGRTDEWRIRRSVRGDSRWATKHKIRREDKTDSRNESSSQDKHERQEQ